jgi:hypothetical protein
LRRIEKDDSFGSTRTEYAGAELDPDPPGAGPSSDGPHPVASGSAQLNEIDKARVVPPRVLMIVEPSNRLAKTATADFTAAPNPSKRQSASMALDRVVLAHVRPST